MLGLISRTIKYMESLTNIYKSLVRPHLYYCSSVWNPHLSKDKFYLKEFNTASPVCSQILESCHMNRDWAISVCGPWKKDATEQTYLKYLKW